MVVRILTGGVSREHNGREYAVKNGGEGPGVQANR